MSTITDSLIRLNGDTINEAGHKPEQVPVSGFAASGYSLRTERFSDAVHMGVAVGQAATGCSSTDCKELSTTSSTSRCAAMLMWAASSMTTLRTFGRSGRSARSPGMTPGKRYDVQFSLCGAAGQHLLQ